MAYWVVGVISVYRSAVLRIEQILLSDSVPILAIVILSLNKVSMAWQSSHLKIAFSKDGIS